MTVYHKAGNAEAEEKMGLAALLAQSSTAGIAATGVLYGLAVTQTTTASGSVQIAQGAGAVQGSLTAGVSLLYNPAPTLNILTGNPVGALPRYDIVVFDSLTGNASAIIGTPNATPTDPTVPNTALKLARIRNAANATTIPAANIDDLRVYTQLLMPLGYRATTSGVDSITPSAANVPTSKAVAFPPGFFTAAPNVMLTLSTAVPGTGATGIAATNVTATGFTAWITRTNTTTTSFYWMAVQA